MIGHVSPRLRLPPVSLARQWLQTLIVSVLAVFAASYFYFTSARALARFDAGSYMPLATGDPGKCLSSLEALLDDNRPYPGIIVDGYFGAQTQQAVIDFQSARNLAGGGVVAAQTAHAINEFSPWPSIFSYTAGSADSKLSRVWKLTGFLTLRPPRRGSRLRRSCGRGRRSSHPPTASHDHDGRHCGTWATPLPTWPS
jgi:peptidoglycan hydrolase-like protein with peptidoglycan-binding domain